MVQGGGFLDRWLDTGGNSSDPVSVVIDATRGKNQGSLISKVWQKLTSLAKSYGPTWIFLGMFLATINFWTVFILLSIWVSSSSSTDLTGDSSSWWSFVVSFLPTSISSTISHSIQSFWGRFFITWALNRVTHPLRFWIALMLLKPLAPRLDPKLKAIYFKLHFKITRLFSSRRKRTAGGSTTHHDSEEEEWAEYQRQHIHGGECDAELGIGSAVKRSSVSVAPPPLSPTPGILSAGGTPSPLLGSHQPYPLGSSASSLPPSQAPILRVKEKSG